MLVCLVLALEMANNLLELSEWGKLIYWDLEK